MNCTKSETLLVELNGVGGMGIKTRVSISYAHIPCVSRFVVPNWEGHHPFESEQLAELRSVLL